MRSTTLILLLAVFWTALVGFFSLGSIGNIGQSIPIANKDKYVHVVFYFMFTMLWYLYRSQEKPNAYNKIIVLIAALLFGIAMEICQGLFTSNRSPELLDVVANSAGAILGMLFITTILKLKTK